LLPSMLVPRSTPACGLLTGR